MHTIILVLSFTFLLLSSWTLIGSPPNQLNDKVLEPKPEDAPSAQPEPAPFTTSSLTVQLPDVTLIDHSGAPVRLRSLVPNDKPVLLDFFFASCSSICPVLSAAFADVQARLAPNTPQAQLLSIAIDPEHDTPEVLRSYLARHNAQPGWTLLTGRKEDIVIVMKAFNAYVENKMSHKPLNFIHLPGSSEWLRLEGTASGEALFKALRSTPARSSHP